MIAGLEDISGGKLIKNNEVLNDVGPGDRGVAMVFQDYALYPHMTVYENMAFALRLKKLEEKEIDARIKEGSKDVRSWCLSQAETSAIVWWAKAESCDG